MYRTKKPHGPLAGRLTLMLVAVALTPSVLAAAPDTDAPKPPRTPARRQHNDLAKLEQRLESVEKRLAEMTAVLERIDDRLDQQPTALPAPPRPPALPHGLKRDDLQRYTDEWRQRWHTWQQDARDRYEQLERDIQKHTAAWREWKHELERHWNDDADSRPTTTNTQNHDAVNEYHLNARQGELLYSLLAPPNVTVIVSRNGDRVTVRGSLQEIDALDVGLQLLNWTRRGDAFDHMIEGERVRKKYDFDKEKTDLLFDMLAPGDVRMIVSRQGRNALSIVGTQREHEVLEEMLEIFRWQ